MTIEPAPAESPTPASAWYNGERTYRLPSGNVAVLRKPQVLSMIADGSIPNPLRDTVLAMFGASDRSPDDTTVEERMRAMLWLASSCVVSPRVVTDREPGDGELHVSQLSDEDKLALAEWAVEELTRLDQFRGGQLGDARGDGGQVGDEAVVAAGAAA